MLTENSNIEREADKLGIYIHFPFCMQKCYYCDFYSISIQDINRNYQELEKLYTNRIIKEFYFRYPYFKDFKEVNTIYFGGGTASFLSSHSIKCILNVIKNHFNLSRNCEITLEGNPEHLYNFDYLSAIKEEGINRINVGIQTKNFNYLNLMNRMYSEDHYNQVFINIPKLFNNWGVDLIYGFSDQTLEEFIQDLNFVLTFPIKHLSLYTLTVEAGTPYEKLIKEKKLKQPNESIQEKIFFLVPNLLKNHNFYMYEVSNYSQKDYYCRHNLRYWLYEPYMGLGPSAHGFTGYYRYNNYRNWEKWLKNFHENYILHEPLKELAITIFRLFIPISYKWIEEIIPDPVIFFDFFEYLHHKGYGNIIINNFNKYFLWNLKGLALLNSMILEFFEFVIEEKYVKFS